MSITVETIPREVFGQIAQPVFEGRGSYDDQTRERVMERIYQEGEVIGRTAILKVIEDGVGGKQIVSRPKPEVHDPIPQGI
jgi:hypothetical protein